MRYVAVLLALAMTALTVAQLDPGTNEPPAWASQTLKELKAEGLLVGYPDGLCYRGRHYVSRYELAVATYAVYSNLRQVLETLESDEKAATEAATWNDAPDYRWAANQAISLSEEFQPELMKLGADVPELILDVQTFPARFAAIFGPPLICEWIPIDDFPDIPVGHWAANAANELKAAGILHGYPDKLFRG